MYKLEVLHHCGKRVKTEKVRKFWGLTPTFVEVAGEKLVRGGGAFYLPPIVNRVNRYKHHHAEALFIFSLC